MHKDYFEMKKAFEERRKEVVEVAKENGVEVGEVEVEGRVGL